MQKEAKLRKFIFPSSGETVYLPRVSVAALAMKVERKLKPPPPPVQKIDYGDGNVIEDVNYSHPDYKQALAHHKMRIDSMVGELLMKRLFAIRLNEEQARVVAAWKDENPDLWDEDDSDVNLYLEEIAIADDGDFTAMMEFINADPGLEAIETMVDGFRGEVPGPADHVVDNATQRGDD